MDEQTDIGLLGDHCEDLVQHRLRSGCRTSERTRLEAEIEKDMKMRE